MSRKISRGDMYYADLNPVIGSEQGGVRPVLIIQNNMGNLYSPTIIVAALSGKVSEKSNLPTHYNSSGNVWQGCRKNRFADALQGAGLCRVTRGIPCASGTDKDD